MNHSMIDVKQYEKYKENKKCDDGGTSINLKIFFNFINNINKIISINLGNANNILIKYDKRIKELNLPHTLCVKEERLRIEQHADVIDPIDCLKVVSLRIQLKEKKFRGLTNTRSLEDF